MLDSPHVRRPARTFIVHAQLTVHNSKPCIPSLLLFLDLPPPPSPLLRSQQLILNLRHVHVLYARRYASFFLLEDSLRDGENVEEFFFRETGACLDESQRVLTHTQGVEKIWGKEG
jgi:hypothetical protein